MVRAPGFAPRSSEWQSESLLLTSLAVVAGALVVSWTIGVF